MSNYFRTTRTVTYGFLAAVPLFILYEALIIMVHRPGEIMIRVGTDIWIKRFLYTLGVKGHLMLGLVVCLMGLAIFIYERDQEITIDGGYFFGMFLESIFYSVLLAMLIGKLVSHIFADMPRSTLLGYPLAAGATGSDLGLRLALSIGAGLYEELFFRVLLVGVLFWICHGFLITNERWAYVWAAIVAALVFSAVHYTGVYGDPFRWKSFTFRFLFGLALNVLYLQRGFGIAAWSHAMYDVLLTVILHRTGG